MSRTVRCTWVFAVALLAILLAGVSQAQPPQGGRGPRGQGPGMGGFGGRFGGGFGGGGGALIRLLAIEEVQKELKLGEEQINQVKDLQQDLQNLRPADRGAMRDLSQEERRARFEEMQKKVQEIEKQGENILEPEQMKRLKQIALQLRLKMLGAGALGDPALVRELGISEGQIAKLRELRQAARPQGPQGPQAQPGERPDRPRWRDMTEEQRRAQWEEMAKRMEEARKKMMDQAMEILTPSQKEKLEELKGPEFNIDMSRLMPQRRGDGQGPGQRGRRGPRGQGGPGGPPEGAGEPTEI